VRPPLRRRGRGSSRSPVAAARGARLSRPRERHRRDRRREPRHVRGTGARGIGTLASLPVTFVPQLALFERVTLREAFVASGLAFAQNTVPLLVYGAVSLVLLGFGLLTAGFGLVLVLPLWAASSYAAWKDIFGVRDAPAF
jgi:hypothetical protein